MVELRGVVLDDSVLQLDMTLQSSLGAVEPVATCIGTGHFVKNVFITPPLHLFGLFGLSPLDFKHVFEQLEHDLVFCLGLCYLPLQKLLPFGQQNQLSRLVDRYGSFYLMKIRLLLCRTVFGER